MRWTRERADALNTISPICPSFFKGGHKKAICLYFLHKNCPKKRPVLFIFSALVLSKLLIFPSLSRPGMECLNMGLRWLCIKKYIYWCSQLLEDFLHFSYRVPKFDDDWLRRFSLTLPPRNIQISTTLVKFNLEFHIWLPSFVVCHIMFNVIFLLCKLVIVFEDH